MMRQGLQSVVEVKHEIRVIASVLLWTRSVVVGRHLGAVLVIVLTVDGLREGRPIFVHRRNDGLAA